MKNRFEDDSISDFGLRIADFEVRILDFGLKRYSKTIRPAEVQPFPPFLKGGQGGF